MRTKNRYALIIAFSTYDCWERALSWPWVEISWFAINGTLLPSLQKKLPVVRCITNINTEVSTCCPFAIV